MVDLVLDQDFGYTATNIVDLASASTIDATVASWIVANCKSAPLDGCNTGSAFPINRFPFNVRRSPGVVVTGGTMNGELDLLADWRNMYTDINTGASCNSKAVIMTDCLNATYKDWRIDRCWDGITPQGVSDGFLIENCYLSNVRDDAIDNPSRNGGTVKDTLIDGCFVGFSMSGTRSNAGRDFVVENVLVRMAKWLFEGAANTQSAVWKVANETTCPRIRIRNCVFAVEKPDHEQQHYQTRANNITVESSGNFFLNLSDTPLPSDYPKTFPLLGGGDWVGFTVLQGQAARDKWAQVRDDFVLVWNGGEPEPPPDPTPGPGPTLVPTIPYSASKGTNHADNFGAATSASLAYDHPGGHLVVGFRYNKGAGQVATTSCTFNGVTLTRHRSVLATGSQNNTFSPVLELYVSDDPVPAANATIVASLDGNSRERRALMGLSVATTLGVRSTDTSVGQVGASGTIGNTVSSVVGDLVLQLCAWHSSASEVANYETGQSNELADDEPTRMDVSSKTGTGVSTALGTDFDLVANDGVGLAVSLIPSLKWLLVGQAPFIVSNGVNLNVTLPGTPVVGDVAVVALGCDTSLFGTGRGVDPADGYTMLYELAHDHPGRQVAYKRMGATPDVDVTILAGFAALKAAGLVQMWRGADATTPIDAAGVAAVGTSGNPDAPSYTTVTNNALRIIVGILDDDDRADGAAAPEGYVNFLASDTGQVSSSAGATVLIASKESPTAGAEDPAVFITSGNDQWAAFHFALRSAALEPAVLASTKGTFALTGQNAELSLARRLVAQVGAFSLAGQDVILRLTEAETVLAAEMGNFALAGVAADLRVGAQLSLETGVFSVAGAEVGLTVQYISRPLPLTGLRRWAQVLKNPFLLFFGKRH